MDDELAWARADLERAKSMDERARARRRELDETWESGGHTWRLRTWRERHAGWDVTLTAHGAGSVWRFAWSDDGWLTAHGAGSVWSGAWPRDG